MVKFTYLAADTPDRKTNVTLVIGDLKSHIDY